MAYIYIYISYTFKKIQAPSNDSWIWNMSRKYIL